jgi:hypothetical protein
MSSHAEKAVSCVSSPHAQWVSMRIYTSSAAVSRHTVTVTVLHMSRRCGPPAERSSLLLPRMQVAQRSVCAHATMMAQVPGVKVRERRP